ncbi:MAG: universal stress protein [Okeania sp. SIO3I5]|uniref:universal stress protein n=1 Tax=Okeania sp. SIO3I5 TaxID=2607805 RepID=UPI0013B6A73D|nr:universal stress protein [Okeania sp. SIO3I5]NEQ40344.1 universal stress protein [Okeania sp. SIO3I5]
MINKILLAVAGRGLCEEMLNMLIEIPYFQTASVTVLHVVPPQPSAQGMSAKLEEGGKILAEAVESLKVDSTKVNPRLKQGDPKDIVSQIADEEKSDLIIMGSRGLGKLEAILKNSVSQYVFQLTSRPMLLVKDDVYVKKIRNVMVALDSSEEAKNCLQLGIDLVNQISGGQLILSYIKKDVSGKSSQDYTSDAEKEPILAEALKEAKRKGIQKYRCVTGSGKPGPELCKISQELNVNLLILSSPDRRPSIAKSLVDLDRLLGNSPSDYVRVYANCPVLLVR